MRALRRVQIKHVACHPAIRASDPSIDDAESAAMTAEKPQLPAAVGKRCIASRLQVKDTFARIVQSLRRYGCSFCASDGRVLDSRADIATATTVGSWCPKAQPLQVQKHCLVKIVDGLCSERYGRAALEGRGASGNGQQAEPGWFKTHPGSAGSTPMGSA